MTDAEARTKRCAFTRERRPSGVEDMCLGSGCMAWRWTEDEHAKRFLSGGATVVPEADGATSWHRWRTIKPEERQGECARLA